MKVFKKLAVCGIAVILGLVSPVGSGVAADLGYSVTTEAAENIYLSKSKVTVGVGFTDNTVFVSDAKGDVTWSISDKRIASIRGTGLSVVITGKKTGSAVITAKADNKSYKCKLTVKNMPQISKHSISLVKGQSSTLTVTGTASTPKWSTSNKKVATIKKVSARKYRIQTKSVGTAIIKAKVNGKTLKCKVTVNKNTSASQKPPVKYASTKHVSMDGKSTESDKYLFSNGLFDLSKAKKIPWGNFQIGSTVYSLNFSGKDVPLKIELREQRDHMDHPSLVLGTTDKSLMINPNDILISGYNKNLITVTVDTDLCKKENYKNFNVIVHPSGKKGGTTYITFNYRGLIFKTKVIVDANTKNRLPVDCERCGFKCNDWYTEHGLDPEKWMYYRFD